MTTISIIGSGNMAAAIGTRAAKHGHTIELMSRNTAKAQALADQIGNGATVGTFGARPAGDIVIVAVLYTGAVEVVAHYGDALAGKILVDITNPFNADVSGLVTTAGDGPASSWWAWRATAPALTSPWAPKSSEDSLQE
jgi:predicted dinucleotide-binding enzyme